MSVGLLLVVRCLLAVAVVLKTKVVERFNFT